MSLAVLCMSFLLFYLCSYAICFDVSSFTVLRMFFIISSIYRLGDYYGVVTYIALDLLS